MKDKNKFLTKKRKENGILIAAHRGTCGGNVVQNTILAYETALQHGADMVEIDVVMSTDGDFFAFHNGQESMVLGTNQDIRTMSTEEIEARNCCNQMGEMAGQKLERLSFILKRLKGRCLINIDRSWFYWKETIAFLNQQDMQEQILLKSAPEDELLQVLQECGPDIMYMPIVKSMEDWERTKKYQINVVAAELIFETLENPLVQPAFLKELHQEGMLIWVNAITLNETIVLSAHLEDNGAIAEGYEQHWGKLADMGFDIIQTDWPALIKGYLLQR